jgi:uncharacterized membrane protein
MTSRREWIITQLTGRLWFWAALYTVGAIATALVSILLSPLIPEHVSAELGSEAVEDILQILASSMLAVATFSLSTMVSAFAATVATTTPRAGQLLLEDRTAQNAIASFVGAFLFSLVGIIALRAGLYGASGRLILFAVTIVVVLTVVIMLLKWIDHLSRLGRIDVILDRLEESALSALSSEFLLPNTPLQPHFAVTFAVKATEIGYLAFLDLDHLRQLANKAGGHVSVLRRSGSFVETGEPLAILSWNPTDSQKKDLSAIFAIRQNRSVEQDPRYGLILLAEVASRALSPGVNDAGTAIDVLARIVRVLAKSASQHRPATTEPAESSVSLAPITVADVFADVFTPIARDGAGNLEVGLRLQRSLAMLSSIEVYSKSACEHSRLALERSRTKLQLPRDLDLLEKAAALVRTA